MEINLKQAYKNVCELLREFENNKMEASELVRLSTNTTKSELIIGERAVTSGEYDEILGNVKRRKSGYPLQYILGEWEFYGLPFKVGEGVLIPRSDTEVLVDTAIKAAKGRDNLKIIDLCSGTGCVAIALAKHLTSCDIFALEKSEVAASYLLYNVELNGVGVTVLKDDALVPQFSGSGFDIIVSNPPYLTSEDMKALQLEVTFEPAMALYGEPDGLHFYRELTRVWGSRLASGGTLLFEVGHTQAEAVSQILLQNNLNNICKIPDQYGILRVVGSLA